jgi:hypothetical protein
MVEEHCTNDASQHLKIKLLFFCLQITNMALEPVCGRHAAV